MRKGMNELRRKTIGRNSVDAQVDFFYLVEPLNTHESSA